MRKIITLLLLVLSGTLSYGQDGCWTKIAAGGNRVIAIAQDGTLWSWGAGGGGNLGLGDQTLRLVPTQIGTDNDWQTVSLGAAIKTDGTLWVWGSNDDGQLGLGDRDNRLVPTQLGTDTNWQSIEIGHASHSLAVKTDGTLWAWGYGASGQLGNGTTLRTTPTQVGNETNWKSISTGSNHSFAIKTDGTLWVWGRNANGELGIYTSGDYQYSPAQKASTWLYAAAGGDHYGLAVRFDGTLWAWGKNGLGQLGIGSNNAVYQPTQVGTDTNWKKIAPGLYQTIGLKTDGTLWAWGYNNYGQLGLGSINGNYFSPTQIGTDNDWTDVETGPYFGAALKATGEIYTWGRNDYGQLGTGNTTNRSTPVLVNCPAALNNENFNLLSATIYPNPVKDILTISSNTEITRISIYNVLGQEVISEKLNAKEGVINTSGLQSGAYVVKVESDSKVKSLKVIKQ